LACLARCHLAVTARIAGGHEEGTAHVAIGKWASQRFWLCTFADIAASLAAQRDINIQKTLIACLA